MSPQRTQSPAPLVVATALVALEGGALLVFAVLELASLSGARMTMGVSTTAFFLVYGAALAACAWAMSRGHSWSRSPVVLTQLIQLGLAWSFRGGNTTGVAIALAVVAVIVLAGTLHPASIEALSDDPDQ